VGVLGGVWSGGVEFVRWLCVGGGGVFFFFWGGGGGRESKGVALLIYQRLVNDSMDLKYIPFTDTSLYV